MKISSLETKNYIFQHNFDSLKLFPYADNDDDDDDDSDDGNDVLSDNADDILLIEKAGNFLTPNIDWWGR